MLRTKNKVGSYLTLISNKIGTNLLYAKKKNLKLKGVWRDSKQPLICTFAMLRSRTSPNGRVTCKDANYEFSCTKFKRTSKLYILLQSIFHLQITEPMLTTPIPMLLSPKWDLK